MEQEKLQEWKLALLQEIENLKAQLAPIEMEIRVKQEKLTAIDRLLSLEAVSTSKNNSTATMMDRGKTSDVAYDVLKGAGVPMHYRDLYEAILQAGFEITGKDPATNLIAHISTDPRFKRVKRGTYALKEWKVSRKHK